MRKLSTERVKRKLKRLYFQMLRGEPHARYAILLNMIRSYIGTYRYYADSKKTPPRPYAPLDEIEIAQLVLSHVISITNERLKEGARPNIDFLNVVAHLVSTVIVHNDVEDVREIHGVTNLMKLMLRCEYDEFRPYKGIKALVCSFVRVIRYEEDDVVEYVYTRPLDRARFNLLMHLVEIVPYDAEDDAAYKDAAALIADDVVRRYADSPEIFKRALVGLKKLDLGDAETYVAYMRNYDELYELPSKF